MFVTNISIFTQLGALAAVDFKTSLALQQLPWRIFETNLSSTLTSTPLVA